MRCSWLLALLVSASFASAATLTLPKQGGSFTPTIIVHGGAGDADPSQVWLREIETKLGNDVAHAPCQFIGSIEV
jgi:hypothetical protein